MVHPLIWAGFAAFVLGMIALDLFVLHRRPHAVTAREAAASSAMWVGLGLAFAVPVWTWMGSDAAGRYLAGYLLEKSLSLDNIFVIAMILSALAVPAGVQHRLLFWGVLGALVMRFGFILAGAALLDAFDWTLYLFGAVLLATAVRMAVRRGRHEVHPERAAPLRLLARVVPMTAEERGARLLVRERGRLMATPLLAALVAVETADVVFAVDSIPAIFGITRDTFLVFASNAFAVLGLRSLYFLLAAAMTRFAYLWAGIAAVLAFVGLKMMGSDLIHVPTWTSLAVIVLVLGAAVAASLLRARRPVAPGTAAPRPDAGEGAAAATADGPGRPTPADRVLPVLRFVARSARRVAVTVAGFALLAAGAVMMVTPGPGLLAIVAGLAVLATEYAWAARALHRARDRARRAVLATRTVAARRRSGRRTGQEP